MHIYLTRKGTEYAEEVYDRHCTIKKFLQTLGVNAADAEDDACEMEHVISENTFKAIKLFVTEKNK